MELVGWRAIAEHLGVSARTAQRYEASLALPVQRGTHAEEVHATSEELDEWLTRTATRRDVDAIAAGPPSPAAVGGEHSAEGRSATPSDATVPPAASTMQQVVRRFGTRDVFWAAAVLIAGLGGVVFGSRSHLDVPRALPVVRDESPDSLVVGDTRGQLVGRIAVDLNENGEWDAGEQFAAEPGRSCPNARVIPGIVVRWEGVSKGSSSAMNCNPDPFYHANLEPGRYRVTMTVPHGWKATSADVADVDIVTSRDTHLWFTVAPQ